MDTTWPAERRGRSSAACAPARNTPRTPWGRPMPTCRCGWTSLRERENRPSAHKALEASNLRPTRVPPPDLAPRAPSPARWTSSPTSKRPQVVPDLRWIRLLSRASAGPSVCSAAARCGSSAMRIGLHSREDGRTQAAPAPEEARRAVAIQPDRAAEELPTGVKRTPHVARESSRSRATSVGSCPPVTDLEDRPATEALEGLQRGQDESKQQIPAGPWAGIHPRHGPSALRRGRPTAGPRAVLPRGLRPILLSVCPRRSSSATTGVATQPLRPRGRCGRRPRLRRGKICYMASQIVGPKGRVIGVDEMLALAGSTSSRWATVSVGTTWSFPGHIQDLRLDHDALEAGSPITRFRTSKASPPSTATARPCASPRP